MFQTGQRWSSDKIYVYLIDSPGSYTLETMKAYSSLEAYQQFFNGWVRTCYLLEVSNTLLLKANEGKSDEVSSSDRYHPMKHGVPLRSRMQQFSQCTIPVWQGEHSIYFTLTNQQWLVVGRLIEFIDHWSFSVGMYK